MKISQENAIIIMRFKNIFGRCRGQFLELSGVLPSSQLIFIYISLFGASIFNSKVALALRSLM